MKKIWQYPLLVLFAAFILGASAYDMLKPTREYSEFETLAQRPEFTLASFLDSSYSNQYTKFLSDQIFLRDEWISLKGLGEQALGKIESNGIGFGKDGYLFEKLQLVGERGESSGSNVALRSKLDKNVKVIQSFLEQCQQPVTFALAPNSYAVLTNKVPTGFHAVDQEKEIPAVYNQLSDEGLTTLDFLPALREHQDEYIYYKTDHHWTTLGAYYAYEEYCRQKGLTPVALDSLSGQEVGDFWGTYYSKTKISGLEPDTITWYDVPVEEFLFHADPKNNKLSQEGGSFTEELGLPMYSAGTLYQQSKFDTRDKYAAFLWGNSGLSIVRSDHNLDHKEGETSRLLLIKDSYANSMVPYLTYNYDEIYVVDLRAIPKNLSQLMAETQFSDIFILYNFSTFCSDAYLPYLKY